LDWIEHLALKWLADGDFVQEEAFRSLLLLEGRNVVMKELKAVLHAGLLVLLEASGER